MIMDPIEGLASVLGAVAVWLVIRRSIWNFPVGLVMVLLYVYIFYQARLYSDMLLQLFLPPCKFTDLLPGSGATAQPMRKLQSSVELPSMVGDGLPFIRRFCCSGLWDGAVYQCGIALHGCFCDHGIGIGAVVAQCALSR